MMLINVNVTCIHRETLHANFVFLVSRNSDSGLVYKTGGTIGDEAMTKGDCDWTFPFPNVLMIFLAVTRLPDYAK